MKADTAQMTALDRRLPAPTVFHQPWWHEIASDGKQEEVTVSRGGVTVGRLPYLRTEKVWGFPVIEMPPLTHVLGPALLDDFAEGSLARSLKRLAVVRELIEALPRARHISFRLHGGTKDTLAFAELGFQTSVDYTVEIKPEPVTVLWDQMRDKTRNVIRRAQETLTVERLDEVSFCRFYEANLRQNGGRNLYGRRTMLTLMREALKRGCARALGATGGDGDLQAAVFTIWDQHREYYFLSSRQPGAVNGAVNLLIWEAIQHASRHNLIFDMDLIHVHRGRLPNLLLVTGFGGDIQPRYRVRRASPEIVMAKTLREFLPRAL